jgi:hypothetical protein
MDFENNGEHGSLPLSLDRYIINRLDDIFHQCEERSGRSNPVLLRGLWIASRSLSSGAHSRDPLARNDGSKSHFCRLQLQHGGDAVDLDVEMPWPRRNIDENPRRRIFSEGNGSSGVRAAAIARWRCGGRGRIRRGPARDSRFDTEISDYGAGNTFF